MNDSLFEARFGELKLRFAQRMRNDRNTLLQHLAELKSSTSYATPLRALHMFAHQYNGSGKTFGFDAVSEAAERLEMVVEKIDGPENLKNSWNTIQELADALIDEFNKAANR